MNAIRVAARRRVALQFAAKDTHRARVSLGIARKSVTSKNPTKKLKKVAAYIKAAPRAAALAKKQRIAALRSAAVDERTARREKKKIALKKKAVEMILKKKAKYKTWKAKVAAIRKRKVARKAATKKKRAVKKAIKATGAVRPFTLFVQKTTTDKKGSMSTTDLAVKWKVCFSSCPDFQLLRYLPFPTREQHTGSERRATAEVP